MSTDTTYPTDRIQLHQDGTFDVPSGVTGTVEGTMNFVNGFQINGDAGIIIKDTALTATDATRVIMICTRPMKMTAVKAVFSTASSSGTITVEKLTGTTAPGSGTVLLTGTIALSGTANTVASGTLIATTASLTFATGDRFGIVIAGTMTSLVGGQLTAEFAPL